MDRRSCQGKGRMQKQLLLVKSKPFLTNTVCANLETWKTSSRLTSHSFFPKQSGRKRAMTSPTWPVAQQRKHLQKKPWKAVQNQKQSMGTQSNQISYLLSCLPYPISSVISSKSTIINYILTCRAVTSLRFFTRFWICFPQRSSYRSLQKRSSYKWLSANAYSMLGIDQLSTVASGLIRSRFTSVVALVPASGAI